MQVVCEAAVTGDTPVRVASLECLVQIATLYYETLAPYIQGIFNVTIQLFLFSLLILISKKKKKRLH